MSVELLCLHGWGLNGAVWEPLAAALSGRARVAAPDLPGHGARAGEGRLGDLTFVLDDLEGGLRRPVTVVGWSLGGLVALGMAMRRPDRVRQVILVAATPRFVRAPDWPHAMEPQVLASFAADLATDYRAALARFLALQIHGVPDRAASLRELKARCLQAPPHPRALAEGLAMLRDTDLRVALAELPMPVTVVLGALDTLVPSAVSEDLRGLRSGADVHVLPGAGHAPLLTHAGRLADIVLEAGDA